jgi:hypothetical protein
MKKIKTTIIFFWLTLLNYRISTILFFIIKLNKSKIKLNAYSYIVIII